MLTAKQAAQGCIRAQGMEMEKMIGWGECYVVLRSSDLYIFKDYDSPKQLLVMRFDKVLSGVAFYGSDSKTSSPP